jgi:hypothetical protein
MQKVARFGLVAQGISFGPVAAGLVAYGASA